ncbi:PD-(D/E)XK nuclease family protein [Aquibacillus sediminis]|uniref:PD-(D/E)XK nuclease family protein n=1 Tax=Aquibacillus sediminis TaxID=2574734 RepID=UPI0014875D2E|nr:PD-(D/E)XK nuclease family protein [Aquibacillus sediminis]
MQIDEYKFKGVISSISNQVRGELFSQSNQHIHFIQTLIKEGVPTPVLSVCGKGTQEIRFTKYFAYYLDEKKFHGLVSECLKAAFDQEAIAAGLLDDWYQGCDVFSEYNLGKITGYDLNNYIDILIKGDDFVVCVEQKLLSGESNTNETNLGQLERYSLALTQNEEFKDVQVIKIYLTPNESIPTSSTDWIAMSHEKLVKRLIPLISNEKLSSTAVENVKRLLLDFILGPYESTDQVIYNLYERAQQVVRSGYAVSKTQAFIDLLQKHHLLLQILRGGK